MFVLHFACLHACSIEEGFCLQLTLLQGKQVVEVVSRLVEEDQRDGPKGFVDALYVGAPTGFGS